MEIYPGFRGQTFLGRKGKKVRYKRGIFVDVVSKFEGVHFTHVNITNYKLFNITENAVKSD